jgi:hypothetical protein
MVLLNLQRTPIEYLSFSTTQTEYFASANDRINCSLHKVGKMQCPPRGVDKIIGHCPVSKIECNIYILPEVQFVIPWDYSRVISDRVVKESWEGLGLSTKSIDHWIAM